MKTFGPHILRTAAIVLGAALAACSGRGDASGTASQTREATSTPPVHHAHPVSSAPTVTHPVLTETAMDHGDASAKSDLEFTDARSQARQFIEYYRTIQLTPEQERVKVAALAALKAPCCSKFTLATCCCPCNMSKSVWGMAAWLITERGYGVEQVRQAAVDWLEFINPSGFSGTSCFEGGCSRPFEHDGCGGMNEAQIS